MIAVIFEVQPKEGCRENYLELAAKLKPTLEKMDGFISIERFESLVNPGKILSLSFWRDEEAVRRWRNVEEHRKAQAAGRDDKGSAAIAGLALGSAAERRLSSVEIKALREVVVELQAVHALLAGAQKAGAGSDRHKRSARG